MCIRDRMGKAIASSIPMFSVINRYYSGIITMVGINIILAVSLNLATGFLGELVLGHAGFMAVGAYCSALITMNMGIDEAIAFPISLLAGGLLAAVVRCV